MDYLANALMIAGAYHRGQVDKAGRSYMEHVCAVVAGCRNPDAKVVAALHDIIEDTDFSQADIERTFPAHIAQAVVRLTKKDGESYEQYIDRIAECPLATEVKRADLSHNADLSRLSQITQDDIERRYKYQKAKSRLIDADIRRAQETE